MTWTSIRLELARTADHPEGSPRHVYILHLPLAADGRVDERPLSEHPALATVHRYWEGERPRSGYVVKTEHGWAISYERGEDDDEPIFHLDTHRMRPGEYVTITGPEGEPLPLRVASIQDIE